MLSTVPLVAIEWAIYCTLSHDMNKDQLGSDDWSKILPDLIFTLAILLSF